MPEAEDIQRTFYERTAQSYTKSHAQDVEHEFALAWLKGLVEQLSVQSMLDVGSGTGRVIREIRRSHPNIETVGIEPSAYMRDEAVRLGVEAGSIVDGNVLSLDYDDNAFDFVTAFAVLHHVAKPADAVREMLRVARKAIFISDINNFGAGTAVQRRMKQGLNALHLWPIADLVRTRGRGFHFSQGDGLFYSYSVFTDLKLIQKSCRDVHLLTTSPTGKTPYRSASFVAILGIK